MPDVPQAAAMEVHVLHPTVVFAAPTLIVRQEYVVPGYVERQQVTVAQRMLIVPRAYACQAFVWALMETLVLKIPAVLPASAMQPVPVRVLMETLAPRALIVHQEFVAQVLAD